jgi:ABC-2 type transport system ATP-binding protein
VTTEAAPLLATHGLVRQYGPDAGVLGVDLVVPRDCVYGLVGPNGAGKTTLLGLLSGLRRPDRGSIDLAVPPGRLALVPDVPEFERWLTAAEVVALAGTLVQAPPSPARVGDELARVGLAAAADRRVGGFSRGMTQRLALAAANVGDPEVVLLDEPSSALDPAGRAAVLDLIAAWAERATVLLSSHILSDVQRVADQVGVLRAGRLVYQGPMQALLDRYLRPTWRVRLRGRADALAGALAASDWVESVDDLGGGTLLVRTRSLEDGERGIVAAATRTDARVVSLVPEEADLESAFLALTDQPTGTDPGGGASVGAA